MTSIAHRMSTVLPRPLADRLRPFWHLVRDVGVLRFARKGRLSRDRLLGNWVASREFDGRPLPVVVRSYREFRRFVWFGHNPADIVQHWMRWIRDCEVLYDIGSANGLEGFFIHHLHGAKVVFVEPYTPSIETLLKTIAHQARHGGNPEDFEVVQAGCDSEPGFQRYLYHGLPIPGETGNTFADPNAYARGGRAHMPVTLSQWSPSVSLDSLHWDYGLPLATHVKIDIDGFEVRAMAGAERLLQSGHVKSWAIELNGKDNTANIRDLMAQHGYVEVAAWEHYPGYEHYTGDHIFVRQGDEARWRDFIRNL